MVSIVSLCLLSAVALVHGKGTTHSIRFPSKNTVSAPTIEEVDSAIARTRYAEGINAVQSIADVVLKTLDNEAVKTSPKNWAVSPLSLSAMIAQLLLGSRGRLQTALVNSFSLGAGAKTTTRFEVHRQLGRLMAFLARSFNESYTLDLNSAVFIQPGITLKPTYKHALLDFYNTQIFQVDFLGRASDSLKKINDWVKGSTRGKLPTLFKYPLPPSTVSLMANIVYFSGSWQLPFDPEYTTTGPFFINQTHQVNADFMYGEKELLYKNSTEMQLIGIPYKNWDMVLYVLMPHGELETALSVSQLDKLISTAERENVTLVMPRIKMLSTISVKQSVLKYLMKSERLASRSVILSGRIRPETTATVKPDAKEDDVFDDVKNFDVSGASEDGRFKIDDVIHQVSLEIDEKGSEIAAVTSTLVDYSGHSSLLKINKPFWFFIRHEATSTHLFWGRVIDPSNDRN